MNTKHTPGPWQAKHGRYVNTSVRDSEGLSICAMPSTQKRPSDEQIANARLIAAAPEMYKAISMALEILSRNQVGLIDRYALEMALRSAMEKADQTAPSKSC